MSAQDVVREMYDEGREKWSSLAVTFENFARYCASTCEDEDLLLKARPFAAEVYLCCACSYGDARAHSLLKGEAQELVRGAVVRVCREPDFIQETLQEFWQRLLVGEAARVNAYEGQGPLLAWLRISATRLALDRYRVLRTEAERKTDLRDCIEEQAFGPESTLTRERFHEPFRVALQQAIVAMSQKDRNLLRMHLVGRCSIDQIGRAYKVHRATAARWLEQARDRILAGVRAQLEVVGPRLTDSEFQSVARVVGVELALEISMFPSEVTTQNSS